MNKFSIVLLMLTMFIHGCSSPESRVDAYIQQLKNGPNEKRIEAAQELAQLGPDAAKAVPELIEMMNSGTTRFDPVVITAQSALTKIGPAAVPELTEMVENKTGAWGVAKDIIEKIKQ